MSTKAESGSKGGRGQAVAPPNYMPELGVKRLETMRWLDENPQALAGYEGKWVVSANKSVCSAADAPDEAIAKAKEAGVSEDDMVVDYIDDGRVYLAAVA